MSQIEWVGMNRAHYKPGTIDRVRMVVIHATAGSHPGDLKWLRQGGADGREVSVHYYIDKRGHISQLVADQDIAWHAGVSRWEVDGKMISNCNTASIGIELENRNNGRDPYPAEQIAATLWLTRDLVAKYRVPPGQLVRHLDISPGRKTDPVGFPWERFVADVYAGAADAPPPAPADQLRRYLLDAAYRAAGGALPAGWPFFAAARAAGLGMPIATLVARPPAARPGSAPADRERALRLPDGARYIVEVYARDTLFAAPGGANDELIATDRVQRLSAIPTSPLRDALLDAIFRAVDPVSGFQPGWAFHQRYLAAAAELGAPISHSHRLSLSREQAYACQHFALDTLCSPVSQWQTIYRLSELGQAAAGRISIAGLSREQAGQIARLLLDDLFAARTGRRYQPDAALVRYAAEQRLGAPLGPAETVLVDGAPLLIMPFALDVVACRLPSPDWPLDRPLPAGSTISQLSTLLGSVLRSAPGGRFARLTTLGGGRLPAVPAGPGPLLGPARGIRPLTDVSLYAWDGELRRARIDQILLAPTFGAAADDLADEQASGRWHYYVDQSGAVTRLRDERYVARAARGLGAPAEQIDQRALVIAVEESLDEAGPAMRAAVQALIRKLIERYRLDPRHIRVATSPDAASALAGVEDGR